MRMTSYQVYIGGLVENVKAVNERDAYRVARKQIITRHGGLSKWLRGVLYGRDTVKTVTQTTKGELIP